MNNRPVLKDGDIVKLSKKGRAHSRQFPKDSTLVVSSVISGDGSDQTSIIKCRIETLGGGFQFHKFYRSELWFTGANAFTGTVNTDTNDGRSTCFVCGESTYRHGVYAICKNINCEWYRN